MKELFYTYQTQIIYTIAVILFLLIVRLILTTTTNRVGKRQEINIARIQLMARYINFLMAFIALFLLLLVWGVTPKDFAVVFSSIFAVIGIALFAVWSILSNITSGVIMFFSFPYKIGDKIKIHDKDYPMEAIIEDIKAFHLILRAENGELVTYPNNLILQKGVSLIQKDAFLEDETMH
ncbi:mechanosensitive ion channel domain-containing protein [Mesonia sp. K7]|uniref:mechanosensitive ion channel domain-containing protein n=1 Tax=Mesonia sp. K7 TaxID=2218606 RepID=UPI000DA9CD91|nr:mechanosensitive ion channel domain-containing protein [Mesonia sp. K7]PZD79356.1 mechanosensitive ion channel family protein [Mesonia sp. K7]